MSKVKEPLLKPGDVQAGLVLHWWQRLFKFILSRERFNNMPVLCYYFLWFYCVYIKDIVYDNFPLKINDNIHYNNL